MSSFLVLNLLVFLLGLQVAVALITTTPTQLQAAADGYDQHKAHPLPTNHVDYPLIRSPRPPRPPRPPTPRTPPPGITEKPIFTGGPGQTYNPIFPGNGHQARTSGAGYGSLRPDFFPTPPTPPSNAQSISPPTPAN